ncbi:MAG TPA: tRNA dihydrouridine synthase DusB [Armatimonadaceae bacterium]|nr:tRNA dihydrouridine synthase DusB [Armatimonadaceae bacterium]
MKSEGTTVRRVGFRIGDREIWPPVVLAPMAGITAHPFRVICKRHGAGLVVTELISSHAIHYKNQKTFGMFDWTDDERPAFCQLFGGEPEMMAEAARIVTEHGADGVDINMGCWVPKVAKTGAGAALLKDLCQAEAVVRAVVEAVGDAVPVTVKVRSGWDPRDVTAVRFAKAAADAGVKSIAVHARFASQGFTGTADWSIIGEVKEAVGDRIPVVGNGDIETPQDAKRMMDETGCDAVMVGRAAMGNPWLLGRISLYLETGTLAPEPTVAERIEIAREHARLQVAQMGEDIGCRELRGLLGHYFKGIPGAPRIRQALTAIRTLAEINAILDEAADWHHRASASDPERELVVA